MFVNFLLPYSWGRGKRQVRDISCMRFFFLEPHSVPFP